MEQELKWERKTKINLKEIANHWESHQAETGWEVKMLKRLHNISGGGRGPQNVFFSLNSSKWIPMVNMRNVCI